MKVEEQVCSLNLAKRLKELNVKQDSYFFYEYYSMSAYMIVDNQHIHSYEGVIYYSAFTVAELGMMLPAVNPSSRSKDGTGWYMNVIYPIEKWNQMYPCETEADARASMLIYLLENGLLTPCS